MLHKLIVLCALVASATASLQYPAGVSPAACPNYPYCDASIPNPVLAAPQPRQYPAGVPAAACPDYPYCSQGAAAAHRYGYVNAAQQYPAGVHPAACPNYPYCY